MSRSYPCYAKWSQYHLYIRLHKKNIDVLIDTSKVFISCWTDVVLLELIIRLHPGSVNVITFSKFLSIRIHGVIYASKFEKVKPINLLREYATWVLLYCIMNVTNNYELSLHIPVPLHVIVKSGSPVASLVMRMVVLKKKYSMFTIGVIISTLASLNQVIVIYQAFKLAVWMNIIVV